MTMAWRPFVLALFGLGMSASISLGQGAGYLLIALWLAAIVMRTPRPDVPRSPLVLPAAAFFVWGVFVTLMNRSSPLYGAVQAQSPMMLFALTVRGLSADDNRRWLRWLCIGAAVSGVIALIQAASGIDRIPTFNEYHVPKMLSGLPPKLIAFLSLRDGRAVATRSHPLTFGESLMVGVIILIAAPVWTRPLRRPLRVGAIASVLTGIVLSLSRGVWLGLLAGLAVIAFQWRDRRSVRMWAVAGLVIIGLSVAFVPKIRGRAMSIVTGSSGEARDKGSRSTRFLLWSAAREKIVEQPIMGFGLRGFFLTITEPGATAPRKWSEAHSIYIQVLGERGMIGLGLFLWILFVFFRSSLAAGPGWREARLGVLAALMVAGITESWVHDGEIDMLFWALLGAVERIRVETPT